MWQYDSVVRRWVLLGGDEKPRMIVPDSNSGILAGWRAFVATLAATVAVASLGGLGIGTLLGVPVGVAIGDKLIVTPKAAMTLSLVSALILVADTINVQLANPVGAAVNQGPVGFDILVLKTE